MAVLFRNIVISFVLVLFVSGFVVNVSGLDEESLETECRPYVEKALKDKLARRDSWQEESKEKDEETKESAEEPVVQIANTSSETLKDANETKDVTAEESEEKKASEEVPEAEASVEQAQPEEPKPSESEEQPQDQPQSVETIEQIEEAQTDTEKSVEETAEEVSAASAEEASKAEKSEEAAAEETAPSAEEVPSEELLKAEAGASAEQTESLEQEEAKSIEKETETGSHETQEDVKSAETAESLEQLTETESKEEGTKKSEEIVEESLEQVAAEQEKSKEEGEAPSEEQAQETAKSAEEEEPSKDEEKSAEKAESEEQVKEEIQEPKSEEKSVEEGESQKVESIEETQSLEQQEEEAQTKSAEISEEAAAKSMEQADEEAKSAEEAAKSAEQVEEEAKSAEQVEEEAKSAEQVEEEAKSAEQAEEVVKSAEQVEEKAKSAEQVEEEAKSAEQAEREAKSAEQVEEEAKSAEQVGEVAKSAEQVEEVAKSAEETTEEVGKSAEQQDEAAKSAEQPEEEVAASEEGAAAVEEAAETVEDELTKEFVIPEVLRSRTDLNEILRLDEESSEIELALAKAADSTLRELKRLYDTAIKPLEILYKYRDLSNRHFGDPEIFSKPLILFMGPWSGGKSSIINYLLDNEYNENSLRTGAEPSPAYFNIVMWGPEPEILDGTQLAADWTFSGLQKFGQGLEDRLRGLKLPNKLLEKVNIVEIPGILEVRKQVSRMFPFNDACQWFIDRADIIFLVYDPTKLDVGPETEAILDQLKGREYQTRVILNKADTVKPEELLRVQGALLWNISPLMSSPQPPIIYTTSLWSTPYNPGSPVKLLQAQERAFLRDIRQAIDKRVENKIASARRFAVRVRNHAKMVDCYLTTYYNHKTFFGNRKQIADDIIENPQSYHIYEGLSTLKNISRYDLPDPDTYRDFFKVNPLYDFQPLSSTCTYFKGCPINRLDVCIAYDLPELVGKHKKLVEQTLTKSSS